MAGMDWAETQRSGRLIGGSREDFGTFEFSSGSQTIDVPCTLARAVTGLAIADFSATTKVQQTLFAIKVGDVSNCSVTFMRAGGMIDEDAKMSYRLSGY